MYPGVVSLDKSNIFCNSPAFAALLELRGPGARDVCNCSLILRPSFSSGKRMRFCTEILERLGSARFLKNQTFPRFSPTSFARSKAGEILINQKFVHI